MISILENLAETPGVRLAALLTRDGVPISVPGRDGGGAEVKVEALAALATQWMADLGREVGGNSWAAPRRVVLAAARGTLVMLEAHSAVLAVLLAPNASDEDLRLPMEGTAARIHRHMREMGGAAGDGAADSHPAAPFPHGGASTGNRGGASLELRDTQNRTDKTGHHQPSTGV